MVAYRPGAPAGRSRADQDELERIARAFEDVSPGVYGAMSAAGPLAHPDLGAGWQQLAAFDEVDAERGVAMAPSLSAFQLPPGVFVYSLSLTLAFDELNAGRQFGVRALTEAGPGRPDVVFVGRNQGGVTWSTSQLVVSAVKGSAFLQVGGYDVFTQVEVVSAELTVHQVGR